ncbi:MAG: SGNH/GDSL hydrolase family protein [bacterium]
MGFTLVTVLGVLEVLARLWLAFDPTSNFHDGMIADPDPEILLRPRPSAEAEVNSLGLRGPEPRENALRRVLVLGDSVTFGHDLSARASIPGHLAAELGPSWEVLNAGVLGYQTWQERRYLERLDPILRPDVVVVVYCVNDQRKVSPMVLNSAVLLRQTQLFERVQPSPVGLVGAFRMMRTLNEAARIRAEVEATTPVSVSWRGTWAEAWSELLQRASRGREALAVIVPSRDIVMSSVRETDGEVSELAAAAGADVVDPLAALRRLPVELVFLPGDHIHLSSSGSEVVASVIAKWLRASPRASSARRLRSSILRSPDGLQRSPAPVAR